MANMDSFKDLDLVVGTQEFKEAVSSVLDKIHGSYRTRPEASPGYRYVRGWYDRMMEKRELSYEFVHSNILLIMRKESKLCSESRTNIKAIAMSAIRDMDASGLLDIILNPKPLEDVKTEVVKVVKRRSQKVKVKEE